MGLNLEGRIGAGTLPFVLPPPGLNDLLCCQSQQHPHVGGELNLEFHRHWEITDQAYQE